MPHRMRVTALTAGPIHEFASREANNGPRDIPSRARDEETMAEKTAAKKGDHV